MSGGKKCKISMSYAEGSSWTAYESMDLCYAGGPHDQALQVTGAMVATGPDVDHIDPVEAPQFAVNAGATNEVKVTVDYLDGYKGKLTVVAAALPKGVTAEPVTVEKKGTATLKLIAALDAPSHNGPLQLTLQPESDVAPQLATVALTSSGVNNGVPQGFPEYIIPQTDRLWLTVLPPKPPDKKDREKADK